MKFIIHTDGGARGNPGPAAVGIVIQVKSQKSGVQSEYKTVAAFGKRIGETTNNVAEYNAVLEGLRNVKCSREAGSRFAGQKSTIEILFFLDSNLVVQQLNGKFKVKDPALRELFVKIKILEAEAGGVVTYTYVPREQNRRADFLVNQALDNPHVPLP